MRLEADVWWFALHTRTITSMTSTGSRVIPGGIVPVLFVLVSCLGSREQTWLSRVVMGAGSLALPLEGAGYQISSTEGGATKSARLHAAANLDFRYSARGLSLSSDRHCNANDDVLLFVQVVMSD